MLAVDSMWTDLRNGASWMISFIGSPLIGNIKNVRSARSNVSSSMVSCQISV